MEQQQSNDDNSDQQSFVLTNKKKTITDDDLKRLLELFHKFNQTNIWSKVTSFEDFNAKRFATGNVNDICLCELSEEFCQRQRSDGYHGDFPKIVVKFYNAFTWLPIDPMERAVTTTLISMTGYSPKLHYIDDEYQVDEYIEARHYNYDDDHDEKTVRQMIRLIAKINSINPVPVSRKGWDTWCEVMDDKDNEIHKIVFENKAYLHLIEQNAELKAKYYDTFYPIDMEADNDFLKELIIKLDAPLVLSHNDLNRLNRLVKIDEHGNKRIYFIDLDYANFNYRGFDLGRYFSNYRHHEDLFGNEGFPDDNEIDKILNEYRNELKMHQSKEWADDPKNSIETMRNEMKIFTLHAYIIDASFCIMMFAQNNEEIFLDWSKKRYEGYLELKKRFNEDGTFEKILGHKIDLH